MDWILTIIIILCIILLYQEHVKNTLKLENFDTYWNHSAGVANNRSIPETERVSRYTWSERKPNGDQLYDKYYMDVLNENNRNTSIDKNYERRDIDTSFLDSKFELLDSHMSAYKAVAPDHPFIMVHGEQITLAQKK